jgi:hypothetical protein
MSSITQQRNSEPTLSVKIKHLMDDAANAQAFRTHSPGGDHDRAVSIPVSAMRSMNACLAAENLAGLFDKDGRLIRTPQAAPSSYTVPMRAAIIANSRVARAGCGVIIMPEQTPAPPTGKTGVVFMETIPGFVRNIEAAEWSTIDVNSFAEVPVSDSPITSVQIDWSTSISKAVRIEVNRKERMRYGDQDKLCDEIAAAITLGLSRAADEVMLSALAAASLAPFTLAGAAAQDLGFEELRAIVGREGIGAAVGQDGVLRAAGVPAALTADMAGSVIGAWSRAAVAIRDDTGIHFERTGLQGQMAITAWASMKPLIPLASKFFELAA